MIRFPENRGKGGAVATGIELARHISARAAEGDQNDPKPMPLVIFVTAFDEFAVEAFEVNALDYLLKPVRSEILAGVLAKSLERAASGEM